MDKIQIQILEDGTIKLETDKVSMPNHSNAEKFTLAIASLCGGTVERRRRMHLGASLAAGLAEHTHDGHTHTH